MAVVALCTALFSCRDESGDDPRSTTSEPQVRSGTALIITGAAARIPQEAALLEALDTRGLLSDLVFVSGVSSGALNSVVLNGILSGRMTWEQYRNLLFSIRSEDIYIQRGKHLPVDTTPAHTLFRRIVETELGFRKMGDLPITTAITVTRMRDLGLDDTAYRLCSRPINSESDPDLGVADVLAATTAIPIVFPPVRIPGVKTIPDIEYVDGGASEDYVPYRSLLEFENYRGRGVARVIVVSRKFDQEADVSEELALLGVDDHRVFDYLGISFDKIADRKFRKSLRAFVRDAPETAARALVWKPDFPQDFPLLDFGTLESQFNRTAEWADSHDPIPLAEFLEQKPDI